MGVTREAVSGRFAPSPLLEPLAVDLAPPRCGCGSTALYRDSGMCETCEKAFGDDQD